MIRSICILSVFLFGLAGCATTPEYVEALDVAESKVRSVRQMANATQVAEGEIEAAEEALGRAREIHKDNGNIADVRYHAYLAQRHAEIAESRISAQQAQQAIEGAEQRRTELLLRARETEAQRNERLAEQKAAEAAVARERAEEAIDVAAAERRRAEQARRTAEALADELQNVKAEQTERGVVLTLSDVLFDTDEAELKPGAGSAIAQLAELLDEYPERRLRIEGHTDSRGSDAYNRQLSRERAAAIADALTSRGINRNRLETVGMGEAYPVATNETAAGRQQNRRVEIVISEPDGDFPAVADRTAVTRNP